MNFLNNQKANYSICIVFLYMMYVFMAVSGSLISNLHDLHYNNQINNNDNLEKFTISKNHWKQLDNCEEIKINGQFYDLKSYKIKKSTVVITAVKDSFENETRLLIHNIFSKGISKNESKIENKIKLFKHLKTIFSCDINFKKIITIYTKPNYYYLDIDFKKFIRLVFKPPCKFKS